MRLRDRWRGTSRKARVGLLAGLVVIGGVGGGAVISGGGTGGGGGGGGAQTVTCDRVATDNATLGTQIAAATTGQTICLTAAVDYGAWNGTNKAIKIVDQNSSVGVAAARNPVSATLTISFGSGDTGFTIDGGMSSWGCNCGLTLMGGGSSTITTGASNITLQNFRSVGASNAHEWAMDPAPTGSNILINHAWMHNDIGGEAMIYIWTTAGSVNHTGITIKNTRFEHMSADAVKLSGPSDAVIQNNEFTDMTDTTGGNADGNHTDALQWDAGDNSDVIGNVAWNVDACYSGYDGTNASTITHNVGWNCTSSAIQTAADSPASTVAWNTIGPSVTPPGDNIQCGNAPGKPAINSLTNVYNNATFGGVVLDDGGTVCTPTRNDHNVTGTITLNLGTNTSAHMTAWSTFNDFCVASGAAKTAADNGGEVGACGGDYNGTNYGPSDAEIAPP